MRMTLMIFGFVAASAVVSIASANQSNCQFKSYTSSWVAHRGFQAESNVTDLTTCVNQAKSYFGREVQIDRWNSGRIDKAEIKFFDGQFNYTIKVD